MCGQCDNGELCDANGQCVRICQPVCPGGCGSDGCGGLCGGRACGNQPSLNLVLNAVAEWYQAGTEDTVFVTDPAEQPANAVFRGQFAYLASGGEPPDLVAINRLFNGAAGAAADHMYSLNPDEGAPAYHYEGPLGWVAAAPVLGTEMIHRAHRAEPFDHTLAFAGSIPAGYRDEGAMGYAYRRSGVQDVDMVELAGSEVTVGVNRVAGGSVWSLRWNGKEFVNRYDFGRQIQIAFQLNNAGEDDNPTEAGDSHATPETPAGWRHGSPLLSLELNPGGRTLSTLTQPLQWRPQNFIGGPQTQLAHPVMWLGNIGKQIWLDFQGMPRVIKWQTRITFPQDQGQLNIELVTAYLPGDFTTFHAYNAATDQLVDQTQRVIDALRPINPAGNGCVDPSAHPDQRPDAGGVIFSTPNGRHAMGVYRNRRLSAIEGYGLCRFLGGADVSPAGFATTKWNLLERPAGGLSAGTYTWDAYLVVGSVDNVRADMRQLYANDL